MHQGSGGKDADISKCFVGFNQDFTSLIVGTKMGYKFYSVKSMQKLDKIYENYDRDITIVERLFSSNLIVTVSSSSPTVLCIHHFRKGTEICRHKYECPVLAVRLNPSRLVSLLTDGIYIHSLRDMKLLHVITSLPNTVPSVCILSTGMPVLGQDTCNYVAYNDAGSIVIVDALDLNVVTTIAAHKNRVACAAFNHRANLIASASEKGTVIRVFSIPKGQKLFEFRRGLKRCATIYSLAFSMNSSYLACSSNTDTVHVFRLQTDEASSDSWMNYFGNLVLTSASYLPVPGAEVFTQGRDFAVAKLPVSGARNVCAIAEIQNTALLLVASEVGSLYVFHLQPLESGYCCPLLQEFSLCAAAEMSERNTAGVRQPAGSGDSLLTQWCSSPLSYASVVLSTRDSADRQQRILADAADVNKQEAEETRSACLQLDDDNEFPPIGRSAFIY